MTSPGLLLRRRRRAHRRLHPPVVIGWVVQPMNSKWTFMECPFKQKRKNITLAKRNRYQIIFSSSIPLFLYSLSPVSQSVSSKGNNLHVAHIFPLHSPANSERSQRSTAAPEFTRACTCTSAFIYMHKRIHMKTVKRSNRSLLFLTPAQQDCWS